ncbi:hypothetical protein [Marinomonas algicola]|uniref:hypothetical protein n=1 Tax=Marinomonas algicola TaxID=2773454 RepID=UPI001748C572|nr:hypothetical protein [Marinomonas algicola]
MELSSKLEGYAIIAACTAYAVHSTDPDMDANHNVVGNYAYQFIECQLQTGNITPISGTKADTKTKILSLFRNIVSAAESFSIYTDEEELIKSAKSLSEM